MKFFFFPWVVFKVTKKWQWLQVKSNALFLKISIPPSHPLQKFQFWLIHTFLLKIWLLRSPPPTPPPFLEFPTNPWDGYGIISGTGYWQTYQLNWNYFLFFLTAIQSHRLLKASKCQAWSWSLLSLKLHRKGNDSTSMKSIWFALFKKYCCSSLICLHNLKGYTLSLHWRMTRSFKGTFMFTTQWKEGLKLFLFFSKLGKWNMISETVIKWAQFFNLSVWIALVPMKELVFTWDKQNFPLHRFYTKINLHT